MYCWSVARSRNGFVVSETPAGACRPGDVPAGGSQMSTSKPFSAPSFWNIACASTIAWWRKPPALPSTRILYVAPGVATNGVGFQNTRIAWSPGSAGPTVTPVPAVSTVPPFTWSISALRCAAQRGPLGRLDRRDDLLEHGRVELLQCSDGARSVAGRVRRRRLREQRLQVRDHRRVDERTRVRGRRAGCMRLRQRCAQDHVRERRRRPGGVILRQWSGQDHVRLRRGRHRDDVALDRDDLQVRARVEHDRLERDRAVHRRRIRAAGRGRVARQPDCSRAGGSGGRQRRVVRRRRDQLPRDRDRLLVVARVEHERLAGPEAERGLQPHSRRADGRRAVQRRAAARCSRTASAPRRGRRTRS